MGLIRRIPIETEVQENPVRAGWVLVDRAPQVLEIDLPKAEDEEIRRMPGKALADAKDGQLGFVSATHLATKAKGFDDDFVSSIELYRSSFARFRNGIDSLVRGLVALLQPRVDLKNAAVLRSAATLGASRLVSSPFSYLVRGEKAELLARKMAGEFEAKPIGFYTASEALGNVFRRDRFLQRELENDVADVLAAELQAHPELEAIYRQEIALQARLTNPPARPTLLDRIPGSKSSFLPPSRAPEDSVVRRCVDELLASAPDLTALIIREVRAGRLDLEPQADSGWYDWQWWAMEPLIHRKGCPEAAKVRWTPRYEEHVAEAFKAVFTLTRETHIKNLEALCCGIAGPDLRVVNVAPRLSFEPHAERWRRMAEGYRFIRQALEVVLGEGELNRMPLIPLGRHEDHADRSVAEGLLQMEDLFFGAYLTSCDETGLTPETGDRSTRESDHARAAARWFLQAGGRDRHLSTDVRVAVPLYYDMTRERWKIRAVFGYRTQWGSVRFVQRPTIRAVDLNGRELSGHVVDWTDETSLALVRMESAEFFVSTPPTREEFRAACDKATSPQEAIELLSGRP